MLRTDDCDVRWFWWSSSLGTDGLFKVPQAVAASLDIEHMTVMEQPVEDRRGEDFVAGGSFLFLPLG